MKLQITRACKHIETLQIDGRLGNRAALLANEREKVCESCRLHTVAALKRERNARIRKYAKSYFGD